MERSSHAKKLLDINDLFIARFYSDICEEELCGVGLSLERKGGKVALVLKGNQLKLAQILRVADKNPIRKDCEDCVRNFFGNTYSNNVE